MSNLVPTRADLENLRVAAHREKTRADALERLVRTHVQTRRREGWSDSMIEAEMIANAMPLEPDGVYAARRSVLDQSLDVPVLPPVQYSDAVIETRRQQLISEVYGHPQPVPDVAGGFLADTG